MLLDFGSGYGPMPGYSTCDITGYHTLDYLFDPDKYCISAEKESFSEIYCRNVIHHVKDLYRLFHEFFRVLIPGGIVRIIDCSESDYLKNVILDIIYYRYISYQREMWFSLQYRDPVAYVNKSELTLLYVWRDEEKQNWIFVKPKNTGRHYHVPNSDSRGRL